MQTKKVMIITVILFVAFAYEQAEASLIRMLDFKSTSKKSSALLLSYDGDPKLSVEEDKKSKQIIISIHGANLPASLARVQDYSSRPGAVVQITPYNTGVTGADSKIVLQLRTSVGYSSKQANGHFELEIFENINPDNVANFSTPAVHLPPLEKRLSKGAVGREVKAIGWEENDSIRLHQSASTKIDKGVDIAKQLIETLNSDEATKVYHGAKITFEANDTDVHDIFRLVGEASGLNIITTGDVKVKLSLSLKDLPWDQMLDIVLSQNQLKASVMGNVVRITTLAAYNKEQTEKKKSIVLEQQLEPIVMAIVPLSFAKAEDMKKMIDALVAKAGDGGGQQAQGAAQQAQVAAQQAQAAAQRAQGNQTGAGAADNSIDGVKELAQDFLKGKIEVDQRSNSLVITNTAAVIKRIKRLIAELDISLPQVLIDAKIVIASEDFNKTLGISWGGRISPDALHRTGIGIGFNGTAVNANNPSLSEVPAFSVSGALGDLAKGNTATAGLGFALGAGKSANLTTALTIGELEGTSKTIASPRVIVNNKQMATVVDGTKIGSTSVTQTGSISQSSTTFTDAALNLTVTPQITSVGSILLDLDIKKDAPSSIVGNIDTKSIKTQVLVDSGATLVLGGVYQYTASKGNSGIPVLKDLPFIGKFFGVESELLHKQELMVFVTPKILDPTPQSFESEVK